MRESSLRFTKTKRQIQTTLNPNGNLIRITRIPRPMTHSRFLNLDGKTISSRPQKPIGNSPLTLQKQPRPIPFSRSTNLNRFLIRPHRYLRRLDQKRFALLTVLHNRRRRRRTRQSSPLII